MTYHWSPLGRIFWQYFAKWRAFLIIRRRQCKWQCSSLPTFSSSTINCEKINKCIGDNTCKPPPSSLPSTTRDNLNASVNRQQMALTASPSKTLSGGDGQRPTSMDRSLVAPSSPMAHGGGRQLMGQPMGPNQRRAPGPPLPRPVLPRERGYMDKVVEYLVGDGPSNRFALICKQCQSHNGMALREEFEYIGKSHFSNNITRTYVPSTSVVVV